MGIGGTNKNNDIAGRNSFPLDDPIPTGGNGNKKSGCNCWWIEALFIILLSNHTIC